MSDTLYSEEFYRSCFEGSVASARQIVPFLKTITNCKSVVDVGCGLGTWLSVFDECGVSDFLGIDGAYVNQEKLLIPRDKFIPADLNDPPELQRSFDLAICLEVAEHLPSTAESKLIRYLTNLSPVVAFSASIPFQDGTGHINEQWLEHWIQLFQARSYAPIDCIRPKFWNNPQVEWWYPQNMILYVEESARANYPLLTGLDDSKELLSYVHPRFLLHKQNQLTNMPMFNAWRLAFSRTWQAVKRRLT